MSRKSKFANEKVFTPTVCIPQPDGSVLLRAGRPRLLDDIVDTAEAARILGVCQRWVAWQCDLREFRTAYKPGGRRLSRWRLAREEVLRRLGAPAKNSPSERPKRPERPLRPQKSNRRK